jgi:hypothetical protein
MRNIHGRRHFLTQLAQLAVLAWSVSVADLLRAQVILHPNQISGTARFNNSNPAILNLLKAPGDEGMSNILVRAYSLPPDAVSASSDYLPVTTRLQADYQVTVDSDAAGISYVVSPVVIMEGQTYSYYFQSRTSAPVTIDVTPPPVDFTECVGVVTVRFVDAGGSPVAVDGGTIQSYDASTSELTGIKDPLPGGITQQRIYLHGGRTHRLEIRTQRGTNYYTDRIDSALSTNITAVCDGFVTVDMVIPSAGTLGRITGNVDMLREFELTVEGNHDLNYADYTSVIANFGPFSNQRWGALGGVNFTTPSSGPYTLSNVVPSTLDPASPGYAVAAQMVFRTNRLIEYFHTPALGYGLNPALTVSPGASIDLSNTFVIDPGYLRTHVLLQGPSESLGRQSLFRGVSLASDNDLDGDGIPDAFGTYGVYWSILEAVGVDRLASGGATRSASGGVAEAVLNGAFNPVTSAYDAGVDMALGGLNGERSIWKPQFVALTLSSGTVTNDDDYYFNVFEIADLRTNDTEMIPSQSVTNDLAYCFGEVKVVFRTTSGTFYNPNIRFSSGRFTGTDFQGQPADYTVYLDAMAGTPTTSLTASNIGQVSMYLPQGSYTLYPYVTPATGTYAQTGLQPIDITVGCGQRIAIEPCLQLNLNAPGCTNSSTALISGSVRSCTNTVTGIAYSLDGGAFQAICTACGSNPTFAFSVTLSGECIDHTLTVVATDDTGGNSAVTTTLHYDATPPTIQCPTNLQATACDTNGAVVNFNVTATDNCSGPVTITCTPPSGSVFPLGTTTVLCVATDGCGNTNQCTFTVSVTGSALTIERAIILTWGCGGTLQSADDPGGPWTDVPGATSPYATPTTAAKKFYRVRN